MKTIEYRTKDKSAWRPGPWQQEPDKVQWKDEETTLPCLIVRNHSGAWCGYVGVAEGHPLHGTEYGGTAKLPKEVIGRMLEARGVRDLYADDLEKGEVRPDSFLDAHGGITFSDFCGEHSRERWEEWRSHKSAWEAEAVKYPVGDSANRLREWAKELEDFDAWVLKRHAIGICHLPGAGEPERVWWFGFDCSHAGDVAPGYERSYSDHGDVYRDIEYVKAEVRSLAKQLAALS